MQLRSRIRPFVAQPTPEEVAAKVGGDVELADNLRRKPGTRFSDPGSLEDAVDDALRVFVESENAKDLLRTIAPDAYEEVTLLIAQRLRRISVESRGGGDVDWLDAEIDGLRARLESQA